jgi:DNA-binding MarR family transcriptional regulator
MLSRVISAVYDDALSDVGLRVSQFSVLSAVANQKEARPADLAKTLEMDESTLSRNVERMRARGWLRLVNSEGDQRSHQITITDKGLALIRKGYPAWEKAQHEVMRRLGSDGVAALKSVTKKLRA